MPKFKFDGHIILPSGLTDSFSRNVSTWDPTGASIAANVPRFDAPLLLSNVEDFIPFDINIGGNHNAFWDSGYDADGTNQLVVLFVADHDPPVVRVYSTATGGSNDLPLPILPLSTASWPAKNGSVAGCQISGVANKLWAPRAACVCHGFIALLCEALQPSTVESGKWDIKGFGVLTSQDRGATWSVLCDDLAR